ncbi:MAG TPA: MDR family oxidoreductase [Burkholderiaceae bacterium]|nr:MDR family oxidoreductase [Burkholderiaceae bacterium]
MFKAIQLNKDEAGATHAAVTEIDDAALPLQDEEHIVVDIAYSTLNFKDALAVTGRSPVVRRFPMVPGIDCAGSVRASNSARWRVGDAVIVNGWGVGEGHWGGLAQRASLKPQWPIARPAGLSAFDAMALGTAGYTAALCVLALQRAGVQPGDGEVLVTGATGGVGGVSTMLLAALGYTVVATTGKTAEADYLKTLGAHEVLDRALLSSSGKPLQKERWAGVVDSVGSHTLANACATTRYGGVVAACGLAQGMDFPATVAPFILRGVSLLGIDSVSASTERRLEAWSLLDRLIDRQKLAATVTKVDLAGAIAAAPALLDGKHRGRLVVDVNA